MLLAVFDLASNKLQAMKIDPDAVATKLKSRLSRIGFEMAKLQHQHLIRYTQTPKAKPQSKNEAKSKPEPQMKAYFKCQLCTLWGGRGNDIRKVMLYLDYSHTFVQFLESMNRETMDSVIPPLGWVGKCA